MRTRWSQISRIRIFEEFPVKNTNSEKLPWQHRCLLAVVTIQMVSMLLALVLPQCFGKSGIFTCSPLLWVFCPLSFVITMVLFMYLKPVKYCHLIVQYVHYLPQEVFTLTSLTSLRFSSSLHTRSTLKTLATS